MIKTEDICEMICMKDNCLLTKTPKRCMLFLRIENGISESFDRGYDIGYRHGKNEKEL